MTHRFCKAERFIGLTLTAILCVGGRVGVNTLVRSELNSNNCSRCSHRISVSLMENYTRFRGIKAKHK